MQTIHRNFNYPHRLRAVDNAAARRQWHALTPNERLTAIRRMIRSGVSEYTVASAMDLSVHFVRQLATGESWV